MTEPDTYPNPPHGWTCYHCGETFKLPGLAAAHFGADPEKRPGCLLKVAKGEERGLLWQIRELEKELSAAREGECNLRGQVEGLEYGMHLLEQREPELMRRLGGKHLSDALMNLDSLEGRVIAAEAYVAELKARDPALWQAIQDHICRPLVPAGS